MMNMDKVICIGYFVAGYTGADPGFQVRGAHLNKLRRAEGGANFFLGISCEKSRFYDNKSYFFQFLGGGGGGGAGCAPPPPGSAPGIKRIPMFSYTGNTEREMSGSN